MKSSSLNGKKAEKVRDLMSVGSPILSERLNFSSVSSRIAVEAMKLMELEQIIVTDVFYVLDLRLEANCGCGAEQRHALILALKQHLF